MFQRYRSINVEFTSSLDNQYISHLMFVLISWEVVLIEMSQEYNLNAHFREVWEHEALICSGYL